MCRSLKQQQQQQHFEFTLLHSAALAQRRTHTRDIAHRLAVSNNVKCLCVLYMMYVGIYYR